MLLQCTEQLESCQSQLRQEHDLRAVTEACLLDERTARQQLELSANGVRKVSKKARKHVDTAIRDQAKLIEQLRSKSSMVLPTRCGHWYRLQLTRRHLEQCI